MGIHVLFQVRSHFERLPTDFAHMLRLDPVRDRTLVHPQLVLVHDGLGDGPVVAEVAGERLLAGVLGDVKLEQFVAGQHLVAMRALKSKELFVLTALVSGQHTPIGKLGLAEVNVALEHAVGVVVHVGVFGVEVMPN